LERRWGARCAAVLLALCAGVASSPAAGASREPVRAVSISATAKEGILTFRLRAVRGMVVRSASLRSGRLRFTVPARRLRAAVRRGRLRIAAPARRRHWRLRILAEPRPQRPSPPAGRAPVPAPVPAAAALPASAPSPPPAPPDPPPVTTGTASDVGLTAATLGGSLDRKAAYHFEWGTADGHARSSPSREAGPGPVTERVTGLSPATGYHFRIIATSGSGADATFATRQMGTVPAVGALLGAWHREPGAPWSSATFLGFERTVGRRLAIDGHYWDWTDPFPAAPEAFDKQGGRLPLDSWDYMGPLDAILDGSQDAVIRAAADRIRAYDAPVLLRPWYEMNGDWWEGSFQGVFNNDPGQTNGPAKYIAAWRRLHDVFAAQGAGNAVWVWSPNCSDWPAEAWNHWTNYYPGDAYVDWVACDEYNWGGGSWASFRGLFGGTPSVYADYPQKPFMISETASCDAGGDKAAWIEDARSTIEADFPRLRALVWFDELTEPHCDWRVTSSPESLAAYRAMAADPYFRPADGLPDDDRAPAAPVAPQAVPGAGGEVRLSWPAGAEPDLSVYRVYRAPPDGGWQEAGTAEVAAYTDSGLAPGERYGYRITAVDAAGNESAPSAVVAATAGA
jgi:Glycosyl hydrolase family 26